MLPAAVPAARGRGLREAVPDAGTRPTAPGLGGALGALFSGDPETDPRASCLQSGLNSFLCWVVAVAFGMHFLYPVDFTVTWCMTLH